MRLSGDQNGAGFGFLTYCQTPDKLFHLFGSCFSTLAAWTLVYAVGRSISYSIERSLVLAVVLVAAGGVLLELWQGIKNSRIERKLRAAIPDMAQPDEIAAVENRIARLDGFSVRDLVANSAGQLVVVVFYVVVL